jgi:hypothetical protein
VINPVHFLKDLDEPGLLLETQEILQFQLRTGHEHLGTLVANTFQEIQYLFIEERMNNVNVEVNMTHMPDTIFRILLALDASFGVLDGSHPLVVNGIGTIHLGRKDLADRLFEDELGGHDLKLHTIQFLGFKFHHIVSF